MNGDHGFSRACPTGNHMTEPVREIKDEPEYTDDQELYDREERKK